MDHWVLVVDDDRDIRESLIEMLEESGYLARGACNGLEALQLLGQSAELPCMILLDLMMPTLDGWGFRERQRSHPEWTAIPVIVISAYSDVSTHAEALGLEYLRKPLGLRTLITAVQRHCPAPAS